MRKALSYLIFILLFCSSLNAQVDNYALRFTSEGNVSLGVIPELNDLSSFTIQFWICPSAWKTGATLYHRGSTFSAQLEAEGNISFIIGTEKITIPSTELMANKWSHVSFIHTNGIFTVRVNNEEVKKESISLKIPASTEVLMLGGNYDGRIDELRIWATELSADYNYMWQNTLNKHHPQWSNLIAYYKFDQNLCPNVVDYTFKHPGSFSEKGVAREIVKDNLGFQYHVVGAYTNFSRFFDRAIDKEKYLLSNTLIILGINSYQNGTVSIGFPDNHGEVTNGTYLADFEGREGVLSLQGQGAKMEVGKNALTSAQGYTFHTWIYLDEWTEGAYLFKKELSNEKGFSIRLGAEESKQVIIRIDGRQYISEKKMSVGKWVHVGIAANESSKFASELFRFTFNGVNSYPTRGNYPAEGGSYKLTGLENVSAVVGENLHAKLDNTVIWDTGKDATSIATEMSNGVPMPGFDKTIDVSTLNAGNSYWDYNRTADMGYDSYSYTHFINIMRSAYDGHRGFHIKLSVSGHTDWEDTFADVAKRTALGKAIAKITNENNIDGVDLDFEWTYNDTGWLNYAKLVETIRQNLKEGKLLTVTPHKVSYRFPKAYMKYVDYFLFQIYGPNDKNIFEKSGYENAYKLFVQWGYPKEKIVMSYATTTTAGMDVNGAVLKHNGTTQYPPTGIRNLFDDSYTPDTDRFYEASRKCYRYFTGYNQVLWRNDFIRKEGAKGIFYWDMGNDVKTPHPYSLVKGAAFSLNANVDTLVTRVENTPPIPPSGIISMNYRNADSQALIIYANPGSDHISFSLSDDLYPAGVTVYDMAGKNLMHVCTEGKVSVSDLPKGTYSVVLQATNKKIFKGTFVNI